MQAFLLQECTAYIWTLSIGHVVRRNSKIGFDGIGQMERSISQNNMTAITMPLVSKPVAIER